MASHAKQPWRPRAFSVDGTLDYTKALRDTLEKKLRVTKFKELEVL